MKSTDNYLPAAALALAILIAGAGAATAQHSDVLVADVGGQVALGAASDIGGATQAFDLDALVFEGVLLGGGLLPPAVAKDFEGDEPGFFALDGTAGAADLAALGASALPGSAGASISLTPFTLGGGAGELLYWDGQGAVAFEPAPAGTTFSFTPAVNFGMTGPAGGLDAHPIFQLDNGAAGKPADGVYAIAPSIAVDGLTPSDPIYLVYLVDALIVSEADAEEVEEALEAVEEGLAAEALFSGKDFAFYEEAVEFVEAAVVPEPSAWGLACLVGVALAALAARRRATVV
ncbi:MAG: hypothetical protein CMJ58_01630 [Planctomycetaceae bacterium]|nr:hypothetical protein [Planctomycetaceae bacterium]